MPDLVGTSFLFVYSIFFSVTWLFLATFFCAVCDVISSVKANYGIFHINWHCYYSHTKKIIPHIRFTNAKGARQLLTAQHVGESYFGFCAKVIWEQGYNGCYCWTADVIFLFFSLFWSIKEEILSPCVSVANCSFSQLCLLWMGKSLELQSQKSWWHYSTSGCWSPVLWKWELINNNPDNLPNIETTTYLSGKTQIKVFWIFIFTVIMQLKFLKIALRWKVYYLFNRIFYFILTKYWLSHPLIERVKSHYIFILVLVVGDFLLL